MSGLSVTRPTWTSGGGTKAPPVISSKLLFFLCVWYAVYGKKNSGIINTASASWSSFSRFKKNTD